ncbi:unnamed protein product [marine sediment metagenome]|uniref:Uncharacterized protein n=1 Tax=marine sediment metagenome TaxID=412755 RepID=X0SVL7_9ZZZZ
MKILDDYFKLQKQIYFYFGYVEDWAVIPIDDSREYFWWSNEAEVHFAKTEKELKDQDGEYYLNQLYYQRFLPRWTYRGKDFTMICVDTRCDGNKFLQIFDNAKERPPIMKGRENETKELPST